MSEESPKVLIVDDMLDNRTLLEFLLEDHYEVFSVDSGPECLAAVPTYQPDIIIMDVRMPEMNGYEVCEKLKAMELFDKVPVVFVSAEDSADEQLKGFQAGGDAYLTKPVDEEVLLAKLAERLRVVKEYKDLEKEAKLAMSTAFEAMSNQSELGIIVRYMDRCTQCDSYNDLAVELLETTKEFGLICSLQIRDSGHVYNVGNGCEEGSIEANLLTHAMSRGKFIESGKRVIVNAPTISILIKNMPFEDPSSYGRLKDHLSMLINLSDHRVKSIGLEIHIKEARQTGLRDAVANAQMDLEKMTSESKVNGQLTTDLLGHMRSDIEGTLFGLGLSEDQEESILSKIDGILIKLDKIHHKAGEIDEEFSNISQRFAKLLDVG